MGIENKFSQMNKLCSQSNDNYARKNKKILACACKKLMCK